METLQKEIESTLQTMERLEEELITGEEQLKNLEEQRSINNEALSALKHTRESKVWVCTADMFISFPLNSASKILDNQQGIIEKESKRQKESIAQNTATLEKLNST